MNNNRTTQEKMSEMNECYPRVRCFLVRYPQCIAPGLPTMHHYGGVAISDADLD